MVFLFHHIRGYLHWETMPTVAHCSRCKTILSGTSHWTKTQKESIKFDVRVGDRVLVHRNLPGIVKYVGDLDNRFTNGEIYVGVNLDDPG